MTAAPIDDFRVLVMAKAPVPGSAKTRLAATVGDVAAAELAAAALCDTLVAATAAAGSGRCVLALAGDLDDAVMSREIRDALVDWRVIEQRGDDFGARLANAHRDVGDGAVVQIGMDTPQVTADQLRTAASALERHHAALGPAADGGWWVLARRVASTAAPLTSVPMSTATTGVDTFRALSDRGLNVAWLEQLTDVDVAEDAAAVAESATHTRFAARWRATMSDPGSATSGEVCHS